RRQRRRRDRERDEGEEAPRRGRAAGHSGSPRGGIVPGGGVALVNAVDSIKIDSIKDPDQRTGAAIIVRALEEPLRQLAQNAGLEGSVVVSQVREAEKGHGLNVESGEIEDLFAAGIIDPTMVTRSALQNAASIAKNILTTEAVVAEP